MLPWRRQPRTRAERLAAAERARARGRLRAAVDHYRAALAEQPEPMVRGKLAVALARLGAYDEALLEFRRAAEQHLAAGFADRALAVMRQARELLPLEPELEAEVARLELQRGRRADAAQALAESGELLAEDFPDETITLLYIGLGLEPNQPEVLLRLAELLRARDRPEEARVVLERLPFGLRGETLRRASWERFRLDPGPGTAWAFLCALGGVERRRRGGAPSR